MADRIQHRRDTKARWAEYNPILLEGEIGYVTDNPNQYKIGDGEHAWNDLPLRGFTGTISQELGNDENAVVSQRAITKAVNQINANVGIAEYPTFSETEDYLAGDVVNYNGELYKFTKDHAKGAWIGTDTEKTDFKNEIKDTYGEYTDSPEFIRAYTDADGKFLWGIRVDGTVEWAKGVPAPVRNSLKELEAKIKSDSDKTEATLTEKINALQEAIDVINASLKPLTDTFSYHGNDEFAHVVTDADGKILFGIKADGKPYFPNNEMYRVIQNDEYLAAWVDENNILLFGIKTDGSVYVAKSDFLDKISEIRQQLDKYGVILDDVGYVDNPEYIDVKTDAEGKIIEATMQDGRKYLPRQELLEKYDDVEERTEMTLDADGRILSYRDKDGVKHEEKLDVNKLSQNGKKINIEDLASKEDVDNVTVNASDIPMSGLDGVQDHSLPNLFNKDAIRTYDSDFADKVFAKIGRKTTETGCYSNNIECKEGDWFTRSDFGTGIVVVFDENENILGDVANAAYQPTIQITPSDPNKYDFSTAKYVVFVKCLNRNATF